MCLGIPMRVTSTDGLNAVCEGRGEDRPVSLMLVGKQPVGALVLVHLNNAVRVLDEAEAGDITRALNGLEAALNGNDFDHLFADLIEREPELPEHLRPAPDKEVTK